MTDNFTIDDIHKIREENYENMKAKFDSVLKNYSASPAALTALEEFGKTIFSRLEGIKENNLAKIRLEWSVGQDL